MSFRDFSEIHTFTIIARCGRTGMLGVGVSTSEIGTGSRVPHVKAKTGAAGTQALTDPRLGRLAINLLELGYSAPKVLQDLTASDAYIALPVVIAGLVQALKKGFTKFFKLNQVGMRLLPFIPIILGLVGGLLLPPETIRGQLLVGGALGTVSSMIYKIVTVSLASRLKLARRMGAEEE